MEKVHFFFKMDQIQDSSLGKYEVIAFESSFLDNLSKIMNEDGKCYFGFDALYSETEEYRIKLNNLRTQLGELGVPYGSSIILKNVENSMWSSMSTKVQRDEKSKSEGRDEDEMSGFIEEPPEKSSNSESNEEEVFETVNEVSLLTFFHFCEKPTPESSKGNLVRRIKDMLLFRRRNSSKNDISGENDQKLKKGKILVIEEKEKQRKMNLINMPDLEFAFLLQDLSEIIMLYNKQFFSMIDQIIITAAQQGSPKPSLRPDNLVRKSEPKVPSSRKHHPLNPEEN